MNEKPRSRYCSPCALNWPPVQGYLKCPGCGEVTDIVADIPPMGTEEARLLASDLVLSRQRHEEFERFCEERDQPKIDAECARFRQVLDALPGVPV